MGIHQLLPNLKKWAPGTITEHVDWKKFTGEIGVVDVSILMYSSACAQEGPDDLRFLQRFVRIHKQMIEEEGLKNLIWVFDIRPSSLKGREIARRKAEKEKSEQKTQERRQKRSLLQAELEDLPSEVEAHIAHLISQDLNAQITNLSAEIESKKPLVVDPLWYGELRKIFLKKKIPFVMASSEAEHTCAQMVRLGMADFAISQDTDLLAYGCPRSVFKAFDSRYDTMLEIRLESVLDAFGWTREQFVDFCILCGSDLCTTLVGVGPVNARKLIDQWKSISQIPQVCSKESATTSSQPPPKKKPRKSSAPAKQPKPQEPFHYEPAQTEFLNPPIFGLFDPVWVLGHVLLVLCKNERKCLARNSKFAWI